MYSNTINCYQCERPLPTDETIVVPVSALNNEPDDAADGTVHLCEDCYFALDYDANLELDEFLS